MTRYHINEKGEVKECKAKKPEKCPVKNVLNEKTQHYNDKNNAEKENEKLLSLKYKKFTQYKNNKNSHIVNDKIEKIPYHLKIDENVKSLLNDIENFGKPLIVGGAVRDSLVGAVSKDIDIEVYDTTLKNISKNLKKKGWNVDEVGKQFGVLKVSKKGYDQIDVAIPRKENRIGAGHKSFQVETDEKMSIEEAVSRRDFTFNALMFDNKNQELIDITGGKKDFENKTIKHISEKFKEDPLRVLRAFQFAGRFNMTIDPETAKMSKSIKKEYKDLPKERIQEEWTKFWKRSVNYSAGIKVLQDTEWDDTEPGLKGSLQSNFSKFKNIENLKNIDKNEKIVLGSGLIASEMNEKDRENFIQRTIVGNDNQKKARKLINSLETDLSTPLKRKVYAENSNFSFNSLYNFGKVLENEKIQKVALEAKEDGVWKKPIVPFIQGRDIVSLTDRKPGKWMGDLINEVKLKQYNNELKNKNDAVDYVKKLLK